MTDFKNSPHIYYKKKYIGLYFQGVAREEIDFHFSGGRGVDNCIKQLNNISTVIGNIHIMCGYICKTLGIKASFYKDEPEDHSNLGLLSLINEKPRQLNTSQIEEKIESLEKTIKNLENKIKTLDNENIIKILEIVKIIDKKV